MGACYRILPSKRRAPVKASIYAVYMLAFTGGACSGDYGMSFRNMSGEVAPVSWQGSLPFQYKLGPGHVDGRYIKLITHNLRTVISPASAPFVL